MEVIRPKIVVLSHGEDEHALAFLATIPSDIHPLMVDVGREGRDFVTSITTDGHITLRTRSGELYELSNVDFWWNRRPVFRPHPGTEAPFSLAQETEITRFWSGIFYNAPVGTWCNPFLAQEEAKNKLRQIFVAKECGLKVPDTIWSDDPEMIKAFWENHGHNAIIKMFEGTNHVWQPTRKLDDCIIDTRDCLRFSPSIVQEYIDGTLEHRVIIFGDYLYTATAPVGKSRYEFDVRIDTSIERQATNIDPSTASLLREYMRRQGLLYAAFDIRENTSGENVFLEVNPMGQFLYLDKCFNGSILKSFCSFAASHVGPERKSPHAQEIVKKNSWENGVTVPYFALLDNYVHHII